MCDCTDHRTELTILGQIGPFSFIESDKHDLAQGLLTYPHQLTRSWFCRLADSIRPADDMSRFYFCTAKLGSPLAGLHGEHLLIRANVEAHIPQFVSSIFAKWPVARITNVELLNTSTI